MKKELSAFEKAYLAFQKVLSNLSGILLGLMCIIVFANVLGRYVFHSSLAWSEEISRFMFIWVVFLGAVVAYVKDEHLSLDLVVTSVPKKVAQVIAVVADLLVIFVLWLLANGGYQITLENIDWLSPAAEIPTGYVYMIVPITAGIMILQAAGKLIVHAKALIGKKEGASC